MKKFSAGVPYSNVSKFRVLGKNAVMMACNRPELKDMLASAEMEREDSGQCGEGAIFHEVKK